MLKLRHPSCCIIAGASQSGKSTLVKKILLNNMYDIKFRKVIWCYSYPSRWFTKYPRFHFVRGLPEKYDDGDLIVLDDLMRSLNEKVAELFTAASHHCNVSVILILQNIFHRCRVMRDISLNSQYIILFKNRRDVSQINCLGRQLYPQNTRFFLDAYIKATSKPYKYLVIDLHPETPEELRVRDGLFRDANGIHWIFLPK